MTRNSMIVFCICLATASVVVGAHADDATPRNSVSKEGKNDTSASVHQDSAKHVTSPEKSGASLYSVYCFGCHGEAKKGKQPALIRNAMENNTGAMGYLKALTPEQLDAISRGR